MWKPGDFLRQASYRIKANRFSEEDIKQLTELEAYLVKYGLLNTFNNLYILLAEKHGEMQEKDEMGAEMYDELADKMSEVVEEYEDKLGM